VSKAWAKGSTRQWRRVRALVLANNQATNQGRCTLAIQDVCTGQAQCVHHELGKAAGDDPRYLKPACNACNWKVGNPATYNPRPRRMTRW
jgi:hypothetical protein